MSTARGARPGPAPVAWWCRWSTTISDGPWLASARRWASPPATPRTPRPCGPETIEPWVDQRPGRGRRGSSKRKPSRSRSDQGSQGPTRTTRSEASSPDRKDRAGPEDQAHPEGGSANGDDEVTNQVGRLKPRSRQPIQGTTSEAPRPRPAGRAKPAHAAKGKRGEPRQLEGADQGQGQGGQSGRKAKAKAKAPSGQAPGQGPRRPRRRRSGLSRPSRLKDHKQPRQR